MQGPKGVADFLGRWRIDRRIEDRAGGTTGRFEGQGVFLARGAKAVYVERGLLYYGTQPPMQAERSYLWRDGPTGIEVFFHDGRPFHRIGLAGETAEARHWCDPDSYVVHYDFGDWPLWSARWDVTGPRKDYVMRSLYRRADV